MIGDIRECKQCRQELPLSSFRTTPDRVRSTCRLCERFNQRIRQRERRGTRKVVGEMSLRLPVAPFRDWLIQRIAEEGPQCEIFAARVGISQRRLYDVVHGRTQFASVDVIDRVLTNDGWHISQLYPDLYPDAPQQVVELLQRAAEYEAGEVWDLAHTNREAA